MRKYIVFMVLLAMLISTAFAENAKAGGIKSIRQALENDGFIVQEGELGVFDLVKIYNEGLIPSAYGNNPTTRYLVYFVPSTPGEQIDKRSSTISEVLGKSEDVIPTIKNLRPDEAIIFVGRTPPECRYFSYDVNLMFRTYGNETRWEWTSLGDPVNNLVIKTEGTPYGQPGNPFNQTTVVITTADKGIDRRIRAATESAGYSDNITNTQVIPSSIMKMGSGNNSDTFAIYIRPALFKDKQAGSAYTNDTPATILRITPKNTTTLEPYDVPELRTRGTGKTEFYLMDDLEKLRQAILNKYSGLNATELPTSIWFTAEEMAHLQMRINPWGPDNDACYLWTANQTPSSPTPPYCNLSQYYGYLQNPSIALDNDINEFIIVYGVNHVAAGKAMYQNIGIFGAEAWNGVGAVTDQDFNGTAEAYLPGNPDAKYLYVYKIARHSNADPHCFEVPYGPGGYGIDQGQPLFIGWRLYLEKATKTGPSYSEILYDRAIKFSPRK